MASLVEEYTRIAREVADHVERLSEVVDEELSVAAALQNAFERSRTRVLNPFTPFWRLVAWVYRRLSARRTVVEKLMSLPPPALVAREHVAVYYRVVETPEGPKKIPVAKQYTAYDLIEMLVHAQIAADEESRRYFVEQVLEALRSAKYVLDGREVTFEEYLRARGIDPREFEEVFRRSLEESMVAYIRELVSVDGSPLAKHIEWRENVLRNPGGADVWFLMASVHVCRAIVLLHAKTTAALLAKLGAGPRDRSLDVYRYAARFAAQVTDVFEDAYKLVDRANGVKWPRLYAKRYEEVRRDAEMLLERAVRATELLGVVAAGAKLGVYTVNTEVLSAAIESGARRVQAERKARIRVEDSETPLVLHEG